MDTAFLYLQSTLVKLMTNILSDGKLKFSSNDAMSNSLCNWSRESHDEPCGKPHSITVTYDKVSRYLEASFILISSWLWSKNGWIDGQMGSWIMDR